MAEVLSQQEIDQLLNKVKSGEEQTTSAAPKKEVIPFDFRLPNRISKNQLRTLRNIFENFAETFASYLVTKLQSIVNINVTSVDQIYYSEYILSVSNPGCLYTFNVENTDVKGVLEINPDLAFTLVDLLLGGNGSGNKHSNIITPIEQQVLSVIAQKIMGDLNKSWQIVDNLEFKIERFESDIDFAQITSQSESVLIISFEIFIGEKSYLMNICFATFAFDVLLSKLSSQNLSSIRPTKYEGTTAEQIISNHLYKTYLPVTVEFSTTKISMQNLIDLEVGDIIKLDKKIGEEQVVRVGTKTIFYGRAGIVNKHKALKITQKVGQENKS